MVGGNRLTALGYISESNSNLDTSTCQNGDYFHNNE